MAELCSGFEEHFEVAALAPRVGWAEPAVPPARAEQASLPGTKIGERPATRSEAQTDRWGAASKMAVCSQAPWIAVVALRALQAASKARAFAVPAFSVVLGNMEMGLEA